MPKHAAALLSLAVAAILHFDWHLARPLHHRLSLGLVEHWAITAALFAIIGCVIARKWPDQRWRLGTVVFIAGAVLAQGVEPVLEALFYEHRFAIEVEPERWRAVLLSNEPRDATLRTRDIRPPR